MTSNRNKTPATRLRIIGCFCAALATPVPSAETLDDRQLAESQGHESSLSSGLTTRWEFAFHDGRALLRNDGTWQIEAAVEHVGLRCASYRLGVRFGVGRPACLNVNWLGPIRFGGTLKHCNNAMRPHRLAGHATLLSETFPRISCAERTIQCSGRCGGAIPAPTEPAPDFGD